MNIYFFLITWSRLKVRTRGLEMGHDTLEALRNVLPLGALVPQEGFQVAVVGNLVGVGGLLSANHSRKKC